MQAVFHLIEGVRLAVYEGGEPTGPALFFLHGNSGAANIFQPQWQAAALRRFRLVALDLPGHGQSAAMPDGDYRVGRLRTVLLAALRTLRLTQALVIGHSYGGHLLLELLPELPTLRGLLAVGTPPVGTLQDIQAAFPTTALRNLFFTADLSAAQTQTLAQYSLHPGAPAAAVALLAANIARTDGRARPAVLASAANGEMHDETGFVARTSVPLAFVVGEADDTLRFDYLASLTAPSRWQQPVHVVPDAGHVPSLENPAAFNRLLLEFAAATARRVPADA